MEDFFLAGDTDPAKLQDPAFIESHGMTLTGPRLRLRPARITARPNLLPSAAAADASQLAMRIPKYAPSG